VCCRCSAVQQASVILVETLRGRALPEIRIVAGQDDTCQPVRGLPARQDPVFWREMALLNSISRTFVFRCVTLAIVLCSSAFAQQPGAADDPRSAAAVTSGGVPRIVARDPVDQRRDTTAAPMPQLPPVNRPVEPLPPKPTPSEFEAFVESSVGQPLRRFGAAYFDTARDGVFELDAAVPADYVVGPGDEVWVRASGQIEMDVRTRVDRTGAIVIPRVGVVPVAGVRQDQLSAHISAAVSRTFKGFDLSATIGTVRGARILVVGQAKRPGSYTLSGLTTFANAVFASGGPSAAGSMRKIQLRRGGQLVAELDLYDLLLKGETKQDVRIQSGDVIFFAPIGRQIAVTGAVNAPAIFELSSDAQTLADAIAFAGGLTTTASGQRVVMERIQDRKARRVEELTLDATGLAKPLADGDLVRVFSVSPQFANDVNLRGFVAQPARLAWREGMRVSDVIPDRAALVSREYWLKRNGAVASANLAPWQVRTQRAELEAQASDGNLLDRARRDIPADAMRSRAAEALGIEIRRQESINWDYALVERRSDDSSTELIPINLGKAVLERDPAADVPLRPGDTITVFSTSDIRVPISKQSRVIRLEGEFVRPGVYRARPGETLRQLVERVGGLAATAYLPAAELTRESTRIAQQQRLRELADRLERELQIASSNRAGAAGTDATAVAAQQAAQSAFVTRIRTVQATGRIVLELPETPSTADLPAIPLEDGDAFFVPTKPSVVSVLGAVYNEGAFLHSEAKNVADYLSQAGGPTRTADNGRIYVVGADGGVSQRPGTWFGVRSGKRLLPGDTIVVPETLDRYAFTRELKDWSQIFYQFALGVAGLRSLRGL
jgi:polysaccharide biosynthesis/export protein